MLIRYNGTLTRYGGRLELDGITIHEGTTVVNHGVIHTWTTTSSGTIRGTGIPQKDYRLYDTLQPGLEFSTEGEPYTFVWRVGTELEPFFDEPGLYYVVLRFLPREDGETKMLSFEATVK